MKQKTSAAQSDMTRIAIAGGGGFAYILAEQLTASGSNAVLVLSRNSHPEFESFPGCQATMVDFGNLEDLRFLLQGIDVLISTISGTEQVDLIDAAVKAGVKHFVPSEFEGALSHRPRAPNDDPLDHGSLAALNFLDNWSQSKNHSMRYTVFSCGIFMERFAPGGLRTFNMGLGCGVQDPGDYMVNMADANAEIVETNAQGQPAKVVLTSVYDVARFVAAALELGVANWPREFTMRGDHMTVRELVSVCSDVRGVPFTLFPYTYQQAQEQADISEQMQEMDRWKYFQRLLQTANGRYNFRHPNLNDAISQRQALAFRPIRFRDWLGRIWGQMQ